MTKADREWVIQQKADHLHTHWQDMSIGIDRLQYDARCLRCRLLRIIEEQDKRIKYAPHGADCALVDYKKPDRKWDAHEESMRFTATPMTGPDLEVLLNKAFAAGQANPKGKVLGKRWAIKCFNGTYWDQLYATAEDAKRHMVPASDRGVVPVKVIIEE